MRIAGSGPAEVSLRKLAARLGVSDAVEIGPVPADQRVELGALLQGAAVVVALSEYESQGLGAHEALALGRPLLVNDGSALRDLAGRANVATVSSNATPAIVARELLALIVAPPAAPEHFPTWSDCAEAVLKVYERVVAR